jgi:uncharacterized delta-60 repeat protein
MALQAAPVQQLWQARYNGPANREDLLFAMTIDQAGRVYVTGSSDNNVNPDPYATVKYDTNGTQLWVGRYTGPRAIDSPVGIAVDQQGYVYVTGFSHGTASGYDPDYATIKYAPEGTELWVARYNAHSNAVSTVDVPYGLVVNQAGEVYVTGASTSPQGSLDFLTIKYNTNGETLWLQRYDGPDYRQDSARALGIDALGNIYVTGISEQYQNGYGLALIKYAPSGTQTWVSTFSTEASSEPTMAAKTDATGNSYIVFAGQNSSGSWRLSALKYDSSGNLIWKTTHRELRFSGHMVVAGAALDDSGNFCVLASINNWGSPDFLTLKFSPAGQELWASRFNSLWSYEDQARSIAVDGDDNIYVTGLAYLGGNNYQFATVKYRPNGHREWVTVTSDPANTGVSAAVVKVDNAGHVYVSGSAGLLGTKDYLTIKYRQIPQTGAPSIITAPVAQTVLGGGIATFSVSAAGDAPLTYQWRRDGQLIDGQTSSTLVLSNLTFADRGYYSVEISNEAGTAASPEAALEVIVLPIIVENPRPRTVILGARVEFSVLAGGTDPFSYQWHRNGTAIPGATNQTFVIPNVQITDVAAYSVVVSNAAGTTNSTAAQLTLLPGIEQCFAAAVSENADYYSFPQLIRVDSQGRAVVAQTAYTGPGQNQMVTVQFETNGAVRWLARLAVGTNSFNTAAALAIDPADNVYVAGSSGSQEGSRMALAKYNSAGTKLWETVHDSVSNRFESVAAMALDAAGNIYLTGNADTTNANPDMVTVKFSPSGAQLWSVRYGLTDLSTDSATDIQVDPAGAIYVFGTSVDTSVKLTTLKYDSDGTVLWTRLHDAGTSGWSVSMKIDAAGDIIVSGAALDADDEVDLATFKYHGDGSLVWMAQFSAYQNSFDYPYALALDPVGNIYIAVASSLPDEQNTGLSVFSTVKYDTNGNELWVTSRIEPAGSGGRDSLVVDSGGNSYVVFGKYFPESGNNFVTYKHDANGTRLWTAVSDYPGLGDEYPAAVALDHEGSLLVSGLAGSPRSEILLVKYKNRPAPGMPVITVPPLSRDVAAGSTVTFSVTATGDAPLAYQWYFDGNAIGGATSSSYILQNVSPNHAGHYVVEVSNPVGTVVSRSAVLNISVPPTIVRQAESQSVLAGAEAVFEVAAEGTRPLHYQWQHNGTNIPGAYGRAVRITGVQLSDSGVYSVVVSNRIARVTSAGAVLNVSRQGSREWLAQFSTDTGSSPGLKDMEVDGAGNVILLAHAGYLLAKYDSAGQQLWSTPSNLPGGSEPAALALDAQGNSYVTGVTWDGGTQGALTMKFDPSGNEVWSRELRPGGHAAFGRDITVAADGSIYITGQTTGPTQGVTTVKYNTNGTQVWIRYHGVGSGMEIGQRVLTDSSGNVYVWGNVAGANSADTALFKYSSAGALLWTRTFGDAGHDDARDMELDAAGNVIVCAYGSQGGFVTIKYNPSGVEQWFRRFESGLYGQDYPTAMAVDAEGSAYVAGTSYVGYFRDENGNYYSDYDALTVKYNSAGELQWSARHGGAAHRPDGGNDIIADGRGGLYLTGYITEQRGDENMAVVRYDSNGTRYWGDLFASESFDQGLVVRTAGSNCVYAAGETYAGGYRHVVLLKYTHQDAAGVPNIVTPPQSQTVIAGNDVTFSVSATGDAPLQYQWYFEGDLITGATGPNLGLPDVERPRAGRYSVEVSNPAGLVVSPDALLTVRVPARIVSGPEDQCIVAGSHALFRVTIEGDGYVALFWQHNGTNLSSDSSLLSIPNATAADGGIYTVTVTNEYGSMTASARLVITPQASLSWATGFTSGGQNLDQANASAADTQGNLYITGSGPGGIQTVKFGTNGVVAWTATYMTNEGSAWGTAITVDGNGAVYVAGAVPGSNNSSDLATLKYDANGTLVWAVLLDHGGNEDPAAIGLDGQGNVYVTGGGGSSPYSADYVTVKYDPDGTQLWVRDYVGVDGGDDRPTAMVVDAAGNVYVTGFTTEASTIAYYSIADYLTVKYDTEGAELWTARHSGPGAANDVASAIGLDSAGNVYVTGSHSYDYHVNSGTTVYYDYDYATIKYNPNGQQLWLATYSGRRPDPDEAVDLKIDGADNVYVTGRSQDDIVTVKYNQEGEQQWVARLDSGFPYDAVTEMALDSAGNIYVTGHSGDYGDILTFKLDTNGTRIWLARYSGPGGLYGSYDYPVGIAVDPAGNVLVGGSVDTAGNSRDYIGLKYTQSMAEGAPVILTPPHDQSATVGSTVTFSVLAAGDAPLGYQWRRNGVAIAGETNPTLQLSGVRFSDSARYSVVVYNNMDCAVSAEASLVVAAAEAVQCAAIVPLPGGAIRLTIAGPLSCYYRIEASSDLTTWETIATLFNATGMCEHIDNSGLPRRFYRIVKQP